MDDLSSRSMKNAANCDKLSELQIFVILENFERKLRLGVESGHVCSSTYNK